MSPDWALYVIVSVSAAVVNVCTKVPELSYSSMRFWPGAPAPALAPKPTKRWPSLGRYTMGEPVGFTPAEYGKENEVAGMNTLLPPPGMLVLRTPASRSAE